MNLSYSHLRPSPKKTARAPVGPPKICFTRFLSREVCSTWNIVRGSWSQLKKITLKEAFLWRCESVILVCREQCSVILMEVIKNGVLWYWWKSRRTVFCSGDGLNDTLRTFLLPLDIYTPGFRVGRKLSDSHLGPSLKKTARAPAGPFKICFTRFLLHETRRKKANKSENMV